MTKLLIPGVTLGAVLIALAFVVAPVQEATAVHTSIQTNTLRHFLLTAALSPDDSTDDAVDEQATFTFNQPFELVAASVLFTADTSTNCDLDPTNFRTDMYSELSGIPADPAAMDATTDTRTLINGVATDSAIFGNVVLSIALDEGSNCDADARATLNALVKTTGALTTAPTGVIAVTTAAKAGGLAGD